MTGRCALLLLLALLGLQVEARGGRGHGEWDTGDAKLPPLPPREDAARVARFVTHVSGWGALATISANPAVRGRPFVDVLSLSDGPPGSGSGVPYFYLSPLMQTVQDLQVRGGARMSEAPWQRGHAWTAPQNWRLSSLPAPWSSRARSDRS